MADNKPFNSFADILYVLVRNRNRIIWITLAVSILTAGISLIMPKSYTSTAVFLVPQETQLFGLSNLQGLTSLGNFGMVSESPEILQIKAIFDSRLLREKIIRKYNLQKRWKNKYLEEALLNLEKRVKMDIRPEGSIAISMEVKTPWIATEKEDREARKLAAEIANEFVNQVDIINKEKRTEKAHNTRIFIEDRLNQNVNDIKSLEDSTRKFSEKYNLINIESQTASAVEAAATLRSQIIETEMMLYIYKKSLAPDNPSIKEAELKLYALKHQAEVFRDEDLRKQSELAQIFPNFKKAPEIGIKYLALLREMKVQELIYEFLTQQFEQAKLQETKDTPTIQILDRAVERELRTKPKRKFLVLFSFFMTFFLYSTYLIILYKLSYLKSDDSERYAKIRYILRGINLFKKLPDE